MELMDQENLTKKFEEEYNKLKQKVQKPGILLAGQTGVGKSSLVNHVFGETVAITGVGKPITQEIRCFENDETSVRIYDTAGYETKDGGDDRFINDVLGMVKNPAQAEVNIIWYCISTLASRVTDYDLKVIKAFSDSGCPVAVLLTKADKTDDETVKALRSVLKQADEKLKIFETSIYAKEYDQTTKLIDWSIERLPEHLQKAFISQQKLSFALKRKYAKIAIAGHVVAAGAVGASPIPFSDAALLTGNELILLTELLYIYDMGGIKNAIKSTFIGTLLSNLGKSAVGTIAKFFPGIGTAVGALINASVAVGITWAFGGAISIACEKYWKAKLNGEDTTDFVNNFASTVEDFANENMAKKRTSEETIFNNL